MSDRRRILRGVAANLASIATRIAVQFATLPIFFAAWDAERIGTWLIIFSVPAYIALVGNAFAGAGGTAALAAAREGAMERARSDFRASWTISAGSTAVLALLFAGSAMFLVPSLLDRGGAVDIMDAAQAAAWLALYIFATSQMAVFDIPFRVAGRYPDHIFLYNAASLIEIVVIAAAVTFSESLAVLAMALALTRCVAAAVIFLSARKAAPEIFAGERAGQGQSMASLWRPSLAFMLVPLVFGLNLQGYLLLVGAAFGAVMLASFVATRTLTRLLDLFTNLTYAMQFYESGYLEGEKREIQRRMLATMTLVTLAVCLGFSLVLLATGAWLQGLYTLGQTYFDPVTAVILLFAASLRSLSAAPVAVLAAGNSHARVMAIYLAGSALALFVAVLLSFAGAPLPLLVLPLVVAEASQLVPATRQALERLEWQLPEFLAQTFAKERLGDIRQLLTTLRGKQ
ncbi:hypothetical protein K3162_10860 [Qipengyuania xiapuensis]|uniref:Membrane protein involved in the export of O-antigen and teichoic acid n=1 Tax=Qipengyuania xiapuensis TaxID=2867236 RepID=A0ABX8ZTE6_9SPHN|nr:hypothetical protein [Qipengyuania xiapuensis]QZD92041.1 hypothetical protein K3162_10860 [Qipengyuania xiapuensis]